MTLGWLIWITGLPGAGKTVIAQALADLLRARNFGSVVLLDGDEIRSALGITTRYLPDERLALAKVYGRLCTLIANQGHTVVCSTVSMFDEIRSENRANNRRYFEVFVRADADLRALRKPMLTEERGDNHVTAEARSYQLPSNADLVLENAGDRSPLQLAECIVVRLLETTNVAKPRHS